VTASADREAAAPERRGLLAQPSTMLIVVLVVCRLAVAGAAIAKLASAPVDDDDVLRFHALAHTEGTPWRDFDVEYAPIEAGVIVLIGQGSEADTGRAVVALALLADLTTAAAIGIGWGRRAAARYLLLGLALLSFIYFRLDALPIALATIGIVLARRGREAGAGVMLAASVLTKVWPVVTLPALLLEGRRRALAWTAAVLTIGGAAWVALGGISAPVQVATFRGAAGWSVESGIGTVVWIVTGAEPELAGGAPRVGTIPAPARLVLAVGLALTLAAVWLRARRMGGDPYGAPTLAAVAALLVWSPLFSLQYALWLTPFVALAAEDRRARVGAWLGATAVVATGVVRLVSAATSVAALDQGLLLLRNGAVIGIVVWWFVVTRRSATAGRAASASSRPSVSSG
jgi:hypothetical protein